MSVSTSHLAELTPSGGSQSKLWRDALEYMSRRMKKHLFNTWLKPTRGILVERDNGQKVMETHVVNQFVYDWLKNSYLTFMEQALQEVAGERIPISLIVSPERFNTPQTEIAFTQSQRTPQNNHYSPSGDNGVTNTKPHSPLLDRYKFDRLVVSGFNEFADAAARAVAEHPGDTKFNPLVIHGGVGLGKTHMIQAIGHEAARRNPRLRICYATSEDFTNDFINSIHNSKGPDFTSRYRSMDILLIDDIQFFGNKESTQEQFFHTFNALYNTGKQIVLTSDRHPNDIKGLEKRLLSRFNSGLVADIQEPDLEARIAILKKKLEEYDFTIPEEILQYIGEQITGNIRNLEGALTSLYARASVKHIRSISLDFVKDTLAEKIAQKSVRPTLDSIFKAVSNEFDISVDLLKSKKRTAPVALARQVGMYLCRTLTDRSLQQIGQDFGGRDHTTVIHACDLVRRRMTTEQAFQSRLNDVLEQCRYC